MWPREYCTIHQVTIKGTTATFTFSNGDTVSLQTSLLVPRSTDPRSLHWSAVEIEYNGMAVCVPGEPEDLEITWDVIRNLTDGAFAREMAHQAAEEAKTIGERLRELRRSRGLTQQKVAELAQVERSHLTRIEGGKSDLTATTLWKLLAVLGYTAKDIAVPASVFSGVTRSRQDRRRFNEP